MQVEPAGTYGAVGVLPTGHMEGAGAEGHSTTTISCPKKMVGRVIGKNGETIKALQNYTGAQIQIDQRIDPTRVSIAGPPKALLQANNMVNDIVAGTFKGFAMLRAYANTQGSRNGFNIAPSQQAPIYIKGYGFVPPTHVDPENQLGFPTGLGEVPALHYPGFQPAFQTGLPVVHPPMYDPQLPYGNLSSAIAQAQLLNSANGAHTGHLPGVHMQHGMNMQQMPGGINASRGYSLNQNQAQNYVRHEMAADPNTLAAQLGGLSLQPANNHATESIPIPDQTHAHALSGQQTAQTLDPASYVGGSAPANFNF